MCKRQKVQCRRVLNARHVCLLLTQIKMCCRSVAVQFGVKIFILTVHFNSFSVEFNGVVEIFLVVFIVTLIFVNLCNSYKGENCSYYNFRFSAALGFQPELSSTSTEIYLDPIINFCYLQAN